MELQKKILITYKFDSKDQMKLARSLTGLKLSMIGSCFVTEEQYDIFYNLKYTKVNPELKHIFNVVLNYYGISDKNCRKRIYVKARQVACYLAREKQKYSLSEIGDVIGQRKHANVIYSVKVIKDELTYNKELAEEIEDIKDKL